MCCKSSSKCAIKSLSSTYSKFWISSWIWCWTFWDWKRFLMFYISKNFPPYNCWRQGRLRNVLVQEYHFAFYPIVHCNLKASLHISKLKKVEGQAILSRILQKVSELMGLKTLVKSTKKLLQWYLMFKSFLLQLSYWENPIHSAPVCFKTTLQF